jgi:hypothetical protein
MGLGLRGGVVTLTALVLLSQALASDGTGRIDVRSNTPGARVLVDDVEVARLPLEAPLAVAPGTYRVTLRAPGYMAHSEEVEVRAGREVTVAAELFAFAGVVFVTSNVEGAVVRVNDRPFGETPILERELIAGEHDLLVESPGYLSTRQSLRILAGERYDLRIDLVPDPAFAPPDRPSASMDGLWRRWWVWAAVGAVVTGGGVAILAGGGTRTVEIYDPARLPGGAPDAIINPQR